MTFIFHEYGDGFSRLKDFLIGHTGLSYYLDKDSELRDKICERMALTDFKNFSAYHEHLIAESGHEELSSLIQHLTIGETYFFRYREQYTALENQILPELIKARRASQKLSIWSAGCATGEELYSVSILLRQRFPEVQDWQLDLLGTDINTSFLERAAAAQYRDWSFRQNPDSFKELCFSPKQPASPGTARSSGPLSSGQLWELLPVYRQGVRFRRHNLMQGNMGELGRWDLIICRNVLIYFSAETQKRLIQAFHGQLNQPGWLLLGPSELTPLSSQPFMPTPLAALSCFRKGEGSNYVGDKPWQPPVLPQSSENAAQARQQQKPQKPKIQAGLQPNTQPRQASQLQTDVPSQLAAIRRDADTGKLEAAETACRKLIQTASLEPGAHFTLALILTGRGRDEEALAALKRTLYLDHGFVLAHYQLGLLEQQRGNAKAAARAYRNALALLENLSDDETVTTDVELSAGRLRSLIRVQQEAL